MNLTPSIDRLTLAFVASAATSVSLYACTIVTNASDAGTTSPEGGALADGAPNDASALDGSGEDGGPTANCEMPLATGPSGALATTAKGGPWKDPATWVGGKVPSATDDVVIHGEVHVDAEAADGVVHCKSVTVAADGILRAAAYAARTLDVSGDFANFGAVRNGPDYASYDTATLEVHVGGRFFQEGDYGVLGTHFTGAASQELALKEGKALAGKYVDDVPGSSLVACSPLVSDGLQLTLAPASGGRGTLDMRAHALTLQKGDFVIESGVLHVAKLVGVAGATLTADQIVAGGGTLVLDGDVRSAASTVEGSVKVLATGVLYNVANATPTWTIKGNLENDGIVRRGPGYAAYGEGDLTIELTGDLTQNGPFTPTKTNLTGTTKQTITLKSGQILSGSFTDTTPATPIAAGSDWTVTTATFDLGAAGVLDMGAHAITHATGELKVATGTLRVDAITGSDDGGASFAIAKIQPPSGTLTLHKHFRTTSTAIDGNLVVESDAHVYNASNVEAHVTVSGTVSQKGTIGSGPGYASYDSGVLYFNGAKMANW